MPQRKKRNYKRKKVSKDKKLKLKSQILKKSMAVKAINFAEKKLQNQKQTM